MKTASTLQGTPFVQNRDSMADDLCTWQFIGRRRKEDESRRIEMEKDILKLLLRTICSTQIQLSLTPRISSTCTNLFSKR